MRWWMQKDRNFTGTGNGILHLCSMAPLKKQKLKPSDLMRESVHLCLRSDVPVAVLLSGGIDSSAVAALARESGREVHVITAGYKGEHDCDERETARKFSVKRD